MFYQILMGHTIWVGDAQAEEEAEHISSLANIHLSTAHLNGP